MRSESESRVEALVGGVVQGVGFRWFVWSTARNLHITGYVRNRFDGRVEIVGEGSRGLLEEFIRAVRIGPPSARVADLQVEWLPALGDMNQFEIR